MTESTSKDGMQWSVCQGRQMWRIVNVTACAFRRDGVLCHLHTHNCAFSLNKNEKLFFYSGSILYENCC